MRLKRFSFSQFIFNQKKKKTDEKKLVVPSDLSASIAAAKAAVSAPPVYLKISFATDRGNIRETNEDNFYIDGKYRHKFKKSESDCYIELTETPHLFGLFDGMGGEAFGETASALSALELDKHSDDIKNANISDLPFEMNRFVRGANAAICDMIADRESLRGGSTFTALCVKNLVAYPFYLGDSRIYLLDENGFFQITEDQTLAVRNIKAGVYTKEEAEDSPDNHMLTAYLGMDTADLGLDAQPCMPIPLKEGTKLMMCSDGLSDMCKKEELEKIISRSCENPAQELLNAALSNGGVDNVTCIVVEAVNLI